jgi:hypothetical protein
MTSLILCLLATTLLHAQESRVHTLPFDSLNGSPAASLADVAWVEGHWRGEAFGGIVEDVWSPPLGNSMMGMFKLVVDGKVRFYEIIVLDQAGNTLHLRLKHFHADLKGWEEKNETVDFPLVKVTPDKVYFDGFTFERISQNRMNIYVLIGTKDGKQEVTFAYTRVDDEDEEDEDHDGGEHEKSGHEGS